MNTCNPAIQTIIKLSITLKLKILLSVLLTVLKFLFSLVRKYFWFLVIVESWPESLKMDSSNADVCSGDVPCLDGIEARCSFSTYPAERYQSVIHRRVQRHRKDTQPGTYSDLEVHEFLRESAHLVIETESIFARLGRREDKISLSLLLPIHDNLVLRSYNLVVDIKGTPCLDLYIQSIRLIQSQTNCIER
jgi:hypothetical protein